jgi:PTS system cellobiose-specific IIC component
MSPFSAVQIPWTTPPIIAGLLLNGWQGAVVQIIVIAMSTAVYFPFVRAQDKAMLAEEMGETGSNNGQPDEHEEAGEAALHH